MSEVTNEKKTENTEAKRDPYKVEVTPLDFNEDCSTKYISSREFCKLTNEYFRLAFADYDGSTFDFIQGAPSVTLYFNHTKPVADGVYACERASEKTYGNTVIDKNRGRDMQMREGDRYHVTDDGKDLIQPILLPRYFNNGNPKWKEIVADFSERTGGSLYMGNNNVRQLTKIIGIDPKAICAILWGKEADSKKDEHNYLDYGIAVLRDMTIPNGMAMPGNQNPNYALAITRAYISNIQSTYEKFGITALGSNIIR